MHTIQNHAALFTFLRNYFWLSFLFSFLLSLSLFLFLSSLLFTFFFSTFIMFSYMNFLNMKHQANEPVQSPPPPPTAPSYYYYPTPTSPTQHQPPPTPPTTYPKLTTSVWEDQNTLCYQVDVNGVCVARRQGKYRDVDTVCLMNYL